MTPLEVLEDWSRHRDAKGSVTVLGRQGKKHVLVKISKVNGAEFSYDMRLEEGTHVEAANGTTFALGKPRIG